MNFYKPRKFNGNEQYIVHWCYCLFQSCAIQDMTKRGKLQPLLSAFYKYPNFSVAAMLHRTSCNFFSWNMYIWSKCIQIMFAEILENDSTVLKIKKLKILCSGIAKIILLCRNFINNQLAYSHVSGDSLNAYKPLWDLRRHLCFQSFTSTLWNNMSELQHIWITSLRSTSFEGL